QVCVLVAGGRTGLLRQFQRQRPVAPSGVWVRRQGPRFPGGILRPRRVDPECCPVMLLCLVRPAALLEEAGQPPVPPHHPPPPPGAPGGAQRGTHPPPPPSAPGAPDRGPVDATPRRCSVLPAAPPENAPRLRPVAPRGCGAIPSGSAARGRRRAGAATPSGTA